MWLCVTCWILNSYIDDAKVLNGCKAHVSVKLRFYVPSLQLWLVSQESENEHYAAIVSLGCKYSSTQANESV